MRIDLNLLRVAAASLTPQRSDSSILQFFNSSRQFILLATNQRIAAAMESFNP
jgi:hypothetical protein